MRKNKKKKNNNFRKILLIILIIIIISTIAIFSFKKITNYQKQLELNKEKEQINNIKSHYSEYVITTKETDLLNSEEKVVGKINKNIRLLLEEIPITTETKYFKIKDMDNIYFIAYQDVAKTDEFTYDERYKKYIPFNKNIKTKESTTFYDLEGNMIYKINSSYSFPIIIDNNDNYGIEFNNQLLYIKNEDIESIYDHHNTDLKNTKGVPVFNYHAFYDKNNATESSECNTSICHSTEQFKTHLDYFKDNNILTLKMSEFELYLDKKLQLPKSVLLTIDDGGRTTHAINMLTEYKMYATIFLITSWFSPEEYYKTEYIELHSHSHDLHNAGKCPGGQGGGIKCLPKETILSDLKTSRSLLNNTTAFCYPFYEYNQYSINLLKEAGFTMAFVGEEGDMIAHPGVNKYRIPRFVIMTHTKMSDISALFNKV